MGRSIVIENLNAQDKWNLGQIPLQKRYSNLDKARLSMVGLLQMELKNGHYQTIKQMCEYAGVTNEEILKSSYSHISDQKIMNPAGAIFLDMIYVLYDKAEDDVTIPLYADWLYGKRTNIDGMGKNGSSFEEYLERFNLLEDKGDAFGIMTDSAAEFFQKTLFGREEPQIHLVKFNDGDEIFSSKQYQRYKSKRYAELIDYINKEYDNCIEDATEESLFADLLFFFTGVGDYYTPGNDAEIGLNMATTLHDFRFGLGTIAKQVTVREVKELVDGWIWGYVFSCGGRYVAEYGESLSKLYLARKCIPDTKEMFLGISYLYERHLVYKRCDILLDKQYLDFSWDSVIKGSSRDGAKATIEDLKSTIAAYELKVDSLSRSLDSYKERLSMAESKGSKAAAFDLNELERRHEKEISAKDEEILRLREQLRSREDYIAVLSTPQQEEVSEEVITPDILTSKRYLFVGCISEEYQELRRLFPNSLFMENPQYNPSNVNVDAVVFLIRNMSHKLFYRVQNTKNLKETPRVYCNARGIKSICKEIFNTLFD